MLITYKFKMSKILNFSDKNLNQIKLNRKKKEKEIMIENITSKYIEEKKGIDMKGREKQKGLMVLWM